MNTWRDHAQVVILRVMAANPGVTGPELRQLLSAAYPFGERKYWPYRVWCRCVR